MIRRLEKNSKVGIVCCSNGQKIGYKEKLERLSNALRVIGLEPVFSDYIYEKEDVFSGNAKERAKALMDFYRDSEIKAIFDISGGDIANEIISELDFDVIADSSKQFWGYSDLTTILNAIYTKTGKASVLYQIRNLISDCGEQQKEDFCETVRNGKNNLQQISYEFIQGDHMEGIVVGGNIRCFLKLAGTPYFPDLKGKILLLEAYGGLVPQMTTYLSQLKLMEVFEQVSGVLLGTFTQLEQEKEAMQMEKLILRYVGENVPIAKTKDIGHGKDAKAIEIGGEIYKSF